MSVGQIRIHLPQLKTRYRFFFSQVMVTKAFYTMFNNKHMYKTS